MTHTHTYVFDFHSLEFRKFIDDTMNHHFNAHPHTRTLHNGTNVGCMWLRLPSYWVAKRCSRKKTHIRVNRKEHDTTDVACQNCWLQYYNGKSSVYTAKANLLILFALYAVPTYACTMRHMCDPCQPTECEELPIGFSFINVSISSTWRIIDQYSTNTSCSLSMFIQQTSHFCGRQLDFGLAQAQSIDFVYLQLDYSITITDSSQLT